MIKTKVDRSELESTLHDRPDLPAINKYIRTQLADFEAFKVKTDTTAERLEHHIKHMTGQLSEYGKELLAKSNI
jgi:hypothetical protein